MFSYCFRMLRYLKKDDLVILQHPNYGMRFLLLAIPIIRRLKGNKFAVLIHDLESLRKGINGSVLYNSKNSELADTTFLNTFDYVISHNLHMTEYLKRSGVNCPRIVELEVFDYLSNCERSQPTKSDIPSIAIAGNLVYGKCSYIYSMPSNPEELVVNLYGSNFEESKKKENITYHGSFKPEELPRHLTGDFGLVWDGMSAETCAGNTGIYLRYNNPHKTSLYLSSNMPVIVWEEAAIADFIRENKVGITVKSLYDIPDAIKSLSNEEYEEICENVKKISKKIRSGYYFTTAINKCLSEDKRI